MVVDSFVPELVLIFGLFFIAIVSAIILGHMNIPYTIGLVVVGVLLAYGLQEIKCLNVFSDIRLTHDIIMYVLLPTLIFDAAMTIDAKLLFKNLLPILNLSVPGLVISTLIVGFIIHWLTSLPFGPAILFGALISATDPVAVVSLFHQLGTPKRLRILVEGESLFNDATAIVLFNIILMTIISGTSFGYSNILYGIYDFVHVFFGGLITGAAIGYITVLIMRLSKGDPLIQLALSTTLAYAAFIVADYYLDVSGVMSVLAAGIMISWHGSNNFTEETKHYLKHFWEFAAFVCNSFIFLLLGVAELGLFIKIGHSEKIIFYIATAIITVTLTRVLVVYIVPNFLSSRTGKISLKYKTIIWWGGLRGAVPLALALSIPGQFESQQLMVELTLGVVFFTLLVQGTTIKVLLRLLRIEPEKEKSS